MKLGKTLKKDFDSYVKRKVVNDRVLEVSVDKSVFTKRIWDMSNKKIELRNILRKANNKSKYRRRSNLAK